MTRSNRPAFLCILCRASRSGCVGRFMLLSGEGCPYPTRRAFAHAGSGIPNLEPAPPDDLRLLAAPLKLIAIQKAEHTP